MQRRHFVELAGAMAAGHLLGKDETLVGLTKPIPSSGERIPVIGMGPWLTVDVGRSSRERARLLSVLNNCFEPGGRVIDSSPMYGKGRHVVGDLVRRVKPEPPLFSATKVWTTGSRLGVMQMEASQKVWRVPKFDLLQVH